MTFFTSGMAPICRAHLAAEDHIQGPSTSQTRTLGTSWRSGTANGRRVTTNLFWWDLPKREASDARSDLEPRLTNRLKVTHLFFVWLVEHAVGLLTIFLVGSKGKQRLTDASRAISLASIVFLLYLQ